MRRRYLLLLLSLLSPWAMADWHVEPDYSRISFVSVKRGDIAEVQRFTNITGMIDGQGAVRVVMPFADLDSGLALRDERMRDLLFRSERFPQAELVGQVDLAQWEQLPVGESEIGTVDFELDLHGHQQRLKADVMVSRLAEKRIQVATLEPVVLKAELFDMQDGLKRLREVANLPAIASEVPVSAILDFQQRP
ncbi:YceI family protein [Stutzerimonas urumqiensis]|uniref:YceI family protein n=1 Tax=Stutzerimonas urumqiensis TaxID=638269 RepID=UPI000EAFC7C6|nr:YceI family protein [Stutzerimonas urumqiensis]